MVDWNKEVKLSDLVGRKQKEADEPIVPAPDVPVLDEVQPEAEPSTPAGPMTPARLCATTHPGSLPPEGAS